MKELESSVTAKDGLIQELSKQLSVPRGFAFSKSHFKLRFNSAAPAQRVHDVLGAAHGLVDVYAARHAVAAHVLRPFSAALERAALCDGPARCWEDRVERAAVRLWTAEARLGDKELCMIMNEAIRNDDRELLGPTLSLVHTICHLQARQQRTRFKPPQRTRVYRGGGLPDVHQRFFAVGVKYRAPMCLSTSLTEQKARRFCGRASPGAPAASPVLWTILLGPECTTVTYLQCPESEAEDDGEYLFSPYTVFTVTKVDWRQAPSVQCPHSVELRAAVDSAVEREDLPVAPWG